MSNVPRVTVLMPVYNGGAYLHESIRSILRQTFQDFEFLIVDDGSSDCSVAVVRSFDDSRIRLVRNPGNLGLVATLNRGLELARGEYIARMDCDDVAAPARLALQIRLLDERPAVVACGCWFAECDSALSRIDCVRRTRTDPPLLRCRLLFQNVIGHPTAVLRRQALVAHGLNYDPSDLHVEDYGLWVRLAEIGELSNVPEVGLLYRSHPGGVSSKHSALQAENASRIRRGLLSKLRVSPDDRQMRLHDRISGSEFWTQTEAVAAREWLAQLWLANRSQRVYPQPYFSRTLSELWISVCRQAWPRPLPTAWAYLSARFTHAGSGWILSRDMRHWRRVVDEQALLASIRTIQPPLPTAQADLGAVKPS